MILEPQQAYFARLRVALEEKYPGRVYDGALPPEGTPYPFIYLGETLVVDVATKGALLARISQSIRVYSNRPDQRGELSEMLYELKRVARSIPQFSEVSMTEQIMPDRTTTEPLLCGLIQITVKG